MAAPAMGARASNTYYATGTTPTPTNVREDLADIIYRIDPDETPIVSALDRVGAEQILTEWLVQELAAADKNAQPEGFEFVASVATAPARLSNVCQILARTVSVSNTLRAANTVGSEDEFNRQRLLRGMEVKRDLEVSVGGTQAKKLTDPREMASLALYCTNGSVGATGVLPPGDGTAGTFAPGTNRALTLVMIADAMEQAYTKGGQPTLAVMRPNLKRAVSALGVGGAAGAAQNVYQTTTPDPVTIVGAVDVYRTDFGPVEMAPDRFMAANLMLLIDVDYSEMAPLPGRDMITETYAKTGDAQKGGVVYEGTCRATAPKAHAAIFSLTP